MGKGKNDFFEIMQDEELLEEKLISFFGLDEISLVSDIISNRLYLQRKFTEYFNLISFHTDYQSARIEQLKGRPQFPTQFAVISPNLPHVYGNIQGSSGVSAFGNDIKLPLGTIRNNEREYEEYLIPHTSKMKLDHPLVSIKNVNPYFHNAFEYEHFNPMQSLVFPVAYKTNENMLICAPTGAGKTDVALLTILRTIEEHLVGRKIDFTAFKIVYIAPMKALASEIVAKFSSRLSPLGINVREYTGTVFNV